ncbi:DnaJ -like protein subfamily C member 21 [Babesia sp. Xinjiang]|uniref:DnaJ -like protein subfamily C member 21 n=1 Tax=Babesia sp. Xinjiang TaxID=462227 RepID=UPI000A234677|nr:DnaJ -like protein subfamily C member 21 [Babesia sp. Xinjiang]ORM40361.1 DnaJ -like protein subfamily C member 21 [Babesia sp. Xinjiang]
MANPVNAPKRVEHTLDDPNNVDTMKERVGSNPAEMRKNSPKFSNGMDDTNTVDYALATSKVVNRCGDQALVSARSNASSVEFDIAEQLKQLNVNTSPTLSNASGTVSIPAGSETGSAAYVVVSREINRHVHVKPVESNMMIRRGYSDDVHNMMKKVGHRLVKTQSHSSARGVSSTTDYGHVYLNIYDLEAVNRVVNVVAGTFGAGAYHAGVEIYGNEYNFGYTPQGGSGIVQSHPRFHASHKYRKSIDLGRTRYSPREVIEIIEMMKPLWLGSSYDILKKNCLNFADAFCKRLGVGGIPTWVMGLQNKINWTRDSLQSGAAKIKQIDEAVGISRAFGSLSRKLTGCVTWLCLAVGSTMADAVQALLNECCYYKLLGLEFDATSEDIRRRYRERALSFHPDKRPPEEREDCKTLFQKIQQAYECLSNEETEFDIWFYFGPCYNGFDESKPNNFFEVYCKCFSQIAELEKEELQYEPSKELDEFPGFGTSQSTAKEVNEFYMFWQNFVTIRTFLCENAWDIEGRMHRRFLERRAKKENSKIRKEFNDNVRNLTNMVKNLDPRMARFKEEQMELKVQKELDKIKVQQRLEEMKDIVKAEIANNMKEQIDEIEQQRELLQQRDGSRVFASHYEEEKPQPEKKYVTCEVCNKVFGSQNQLMNHTRSKQHIKNIKGK